MDMTIWQVALVPAVTLPFVLLFRFTGCAQIAGLDSSDPDPQQPDPAPAPAPTPTPSPTPTPTPSPTPGNAPPDYRKYILGETPNPGTVKNGGVKINPLAVIGYWRLIDPVGSGQAADEKGPRRGTYVTVLEGLDSVGPTGTQGGSEAAPGAILTGQPGLIASAPAALCRYYNGGYVEIPFATGLYTDEFTLEAWVNIAALRADFEHFLFDAGGRYAVGLDGVTDRGFRLFADRNGSWQVRLNSNQAPLFANPPKVPLGGRSHVALVVQNNLGTGGTTKDFILYIDAKEAARATNVLYFPPDSAPLFIAIENTAAQPTQTAVPRRPLLGQVREVVLHSVVLSVLELENHVDINR
jgi:hypothetical protein